MLSERPYTRDDYPKEKTSPLTWLLAALIGAFVLEFVLFSRWFDPSGQLGGGLALTTSGLGEGRVWTLATYWLLHSTSNLFHIAIVLGGLFTLGRACEPHIGAVRVTAVFFGAIVLGGLFWAAVNWKTDGLLMGSVAGVYGLLALYAAMQPNREFSVLLFFFFPVTLKPKDLALGLGTFELLAFVYFEVFRNPSPFHYAPSAHLGGMMAGWIFFRYLNRQPLGLVRTNPALDLPTWTEGTQRAHATSPVNTASGQPDRAQLRAEVDRILDKINSHGLASLSVAEKKTPRRSSQPASTKVTGAAGHFRPGCVYSRPRASPSARTGLAP